MQVYLIKDIHTESFQKVFQLKQRGEKYRRHIQTHKFKINVSFILCRSILGLEHIFE